MLSLLALDSVTLESLLIAYGSPQEIAAHAGEAAAQMKAWGRSCLSDEKIKRAVEGAKTTLGQPCIEGGRRHLQALAEEMRHSRCQGKAAKKVLEAHVVADAGLNEMASVIGKLTTAILISLHLDPRHFANAQSFLKALGLNLTEKGSGFKQGRPRPGKRGSARARKYLYFAAPRQIKNNPLVAQWYKNKADPKAKSKTVTAFMRKLAKALRAPVRGERFDARKLVTI